MIVRDLIVVSVWVGHKYCLSGFLEFGFGVGGSQEAIVSDFDEALWQDM